MNGLILCTNECNLRCAYCFEKSMRNGDMLDVEYIREKFSNFLDVFFEPFITQLIHINLAKLNREETDFTFHGGEVLLVGHDLLEKGFNMVKKHPNTTIGIQTNGTLVDDRYIELFKKYDVKVGVSLDGPEDMHNRYRKNCGGNGTFDIIFNNIKKMKEAGIVVGALATVTDMSVKQPERFYDFFSENEIPFSFNPCFTDPNLPSTYNVLNMQEYIVFYKKMFDLWMGDEKNNLSISCFEKIMSAMCVKKRPYMEVCTFIPDCSRTTVAISPEGDFYRCLHYLMDRTNRIGNIAEDSLIKALGDERIRERWKHLKQKECKDCDIQDYCCGGCPYVAETGNGDIMTKANTCESQKAIVHYIYDFLKEKNGKK